MLNKETELKLAIALRRSFPSGPHVSNSPMGATFVLVQSTVQVIGRLLAEAGPVRIEMETTKQKSGARVIKGLIIFTGVETVVVPMTISPLLVRVRKRPIYLAHEDGAVNLMEAILREVGVAVGVESNAVHP